MPYQPRLLFGRLPVETGDWPSLDMPHMGSDAGWAPLNIHCTTLDGLATVRISTRPESWRVQAIHAAVVDGHHQGVLLIGAPYQCNSLLGATSGIGLELSPRDRICANGQPHQAHDGPPRRRSTRNTRPRSRPAAGRRRTEPGASSDAKPIPALHAHDVFTGVMQLMGLERVVCVGGVDSAYIEPLVEPALDDVDVVYPTCPRSVMNTARA